MEKNGSLSPGGSSHCHQYWVTVYIKQPRLTRCVNETIGKRWLIESSVAFLYSYVKKALKKIMLMRKWLIWNIVDSFQSCVTSLGLIMDVIIRFSWTLQVSVQNRFCQQSALPPQTTSPGKRIKLFIVLWLADIISLHFDVSIYQCPLVLLQTHKHAF